VCVLILLCLGATAAYLLLAKGTPEPDSGQEVRMKEPKHKHENRLINSRSPYLLQHAHNPVDWHPWSEEALRRAKREDKPILLSIGYFACHWCHVMERESFENEEIADIMNKHFVCIKVDREERPDLDEIYMRAVQMMTGSGGWPLNVFLTPDLKPFYGGTYFPPEDKSGRPGFKRVLLAVAEAYRNRRKEIEQNAGRVLEALKSSTQVSEAVPEELSVDLINEAVRELSQLFDPAWGGFGEAPKFPRSPAVRLLLRHYSRTHNEDSLHMATMTLEKMAGGGIYDQLGGGFHRYSVDREWLVPHFEKMLYDNAQLGVAYLEAFQLTKRPLFSRVVRETLDYVLREMTDDGGGFYSTQDADTEGVEGKYYVWRLDEIEGVLSAEDAGLFCQYYGITKSGNFEGANILHISTRFEDFAGKTHIVPHELQRRLGEMRRQLSAARKRRPPPGVDDKILVSWNGLMISTFAYGYQVLGEERYRHAAVRAADFILTHVRSEEELLHAYRAGHSHVKGYLDDHAFLLQGLLDLYETTFDSRSIQHAQSLAQQMLRQFWDAKAGGFYFTQGGNTDLILRTKRAADGAMPSGNAVAAHALLRLAKLTGREDYSQKAEEALKVFSASLERFPSEFASLLCALDFYLGPTKEIAISGQTRDASTQGLLAAIRERYLPNKVVGVIDPNAKDAGEIVRMIPLLASRPMLNDMTTAYVCENFVCKLPVTSVSALEQLLEEQWFPREDKQ